MYGAWTMQRLASNVWTLPAGVGQRLGMSDDEIATTRHAAEQLQGQYFRSAQAEAPDDPWIQTFAPTWAPDPLQGSYARMLKRYPAHPFAAWWAHTLAARTEGVDRRRFADQFDDLTHDYLLRTSSVRPGFVNSPNIATLPNVTLASDGSKELRLNGGDVIAIGPANAFGSDRLALLMYIDVGSGSVAAGLQVETGKNSEAGPEQQVETAGLTRYRMFAWEGAASARTMTLRLRANAGPVTLRVRDFYPLVKNPRVRPT
jgi:hypothetical protein